MRKLSYLLFTISIFFSFSPLLKCQEINSHVIYGVENDTLLKDYLHKISAETGLRFFYEENLLNDIYIKKGDNGKILSDYFNQVLNAKGVTYIAYRNKNIIFIDRGKLASNMQLAGLDKKNHSNGYSTDIGDPLLAGKYRTATIKGSIRSGKTGEVLPGAIIYLKDQGTSAVADMLGRFSIDAPVGKHEALISYVGFESVDTKINLISSGNFDVELFENTITLDQVVVTDKAQANVASTEMSIVRMDAKTLKYIPVLMGEPDLIRTMTLMPGVKSSGDMASGLNVRGGNTDQNLILIDDVPIYNSSHLFGMYSIVDTRTINNLELYKGGAPAQFGGRASSVMDISLKEGNYKHLEGDGSVGLFSSSLTLQGPLVNNKSSIIISGRKTYSDWILKRVPDVDIRHSSANFYDVSARLGVILNQKNKVNFYAYLSSDNMNLADKNKYTYMNKLASLKWNHIFNNKLSVFFATYLSDLKTNTVDKEYPTKAFELLNGVTQIGAKFRTIYTLGEKQSVEAGFEGNKYIFLAGDKKAYGIDSKTSNIDMGKEHSSEYAFYIQDKVDFTGQLSVMMGLRYSYYVLNGPITVDYYSDGSYPSKTTFTESKEFKKGEKVQNYSGLEPRINLKYNIDLYSSFKIGYSRNNQYLHILSNSTVVTPTDIWKSSDSYIRPAIGDQIMIGYFKNFKKGLYETSIEAYYKQVQNVLEYKNGAVLVLNDTLERALLSADMQAYGIELFIRKNSGRLTGWISYTYSRSFMKTSGANISDLINRGEKYPANFDKPNDLSVVAAYKISRRFTFSSSFVYSTGRPTAYPEIAYSIFNNTFMEPSDRNKYRLPDYHRLDLSLTWDISLKKYKKSYSSWVLSVYNVYGRKNVYSTYYKKDVPTAKNDYQSYALYQMSIIGVPIPSLTYNLRF
jgi:uncharacterized protein YchJ